MQVCIYACMYVQNQRTPPHPPPSITTWQCSHKTSVAPPSPPLPALSFPNPLSPTRTSLHNAQPEKKIHVRSQHTNHPHRKAVLRRGIASTSPLPSTCPAVELDGPPQASSLIVPPAPLLESKGAKRPPCLVPGAILRFTRVELTAGVGGRGGVAFAQRDRRGSIGGTRSLGVVVRWELRWGRGGGGWGKGGPAITADEGRRQGICDTALHVSVHSFKANEIDVRSQRSNHPRRKAVLRQGIASTSASSSQLSRPPVTTIAHIVMWLLSI